MSARWWKQEHTVHHALTNTVDYGKGFVDPQAIEDVWAQNEKLLPFFKGSKLAFLIKVGGEENHNVVAMNCITNSYY